MRQKLWLVAAMLAALAPRTASASHFHGEQLDKIADVLTWIVLIIAPVVGIVVFLMIHVLPEKIAEKKGHPQAKAIQCLCLLSLVFGGMLWPFAWLWAYTKPTLYKMAYGTDKHEEHESLEQRRERLRKELAELESRSGGNA